jgi:Reverse transcriptase (RNA-dependent DNA polymerase)
VRYLHEFDTDDGPAPALHVDYQQNVTEPIVPEVPTEQPDAGDTGIKVMPQNVGHEHVPLVEHPITTNDFVEQQGTTNDFVEPLQPSKNEERVEHIQEPMTEPNPPLTQEQEVVEPEGEIVEPVISDPKTTNLRRSSRSNKGKFTSRRFHEEEFSLLMSTPDPTNKAVEFLLEAHAAALNDPDTLSWNEAMRATDAEMFKESAYAEIKALQQAGTWTLVDKSKATSKILPGIWVFRRKRNQGTGEIYKYKGRYSVRGDLQEGTFDTFAPVVQWSTVRMLMMIALRYGYKTKCIDFSNAFVQAKLSTPVWIHLPRGNYQDIFGEDTEGKCLELKKSLYGLSVAPKLWYLHLREQLEAKGFKPSAIDPCLYFRNGVAIAVYVDDVIMIGRTTKELDEIVKDLQEEFKVTDEGELSGFLGIDVKRQGNKFRLAQPTLIRKIIKAAGLTDCKPNKTPATTVLGSLKHEPPHSEEWEYASMIGMLMYLSQLTS